MTAEATSNYKITIAIDGGCYMVQFLDYLQRGFYPVFGSYKPSTMKMITTATTVKFSGTFISGPS